MSDKEDIGKRLLKARQRTGVMQKDLSFDAGIHANTLSKIEAGRRLPDIITLKKLCIALGISSDHILGIK